MAKIEKQPLLWLIGITGIAILVKVVLLLIQSFPFNSDEAIVALMARHIQAGERPVFFYGQAYMGSLDAYLVAFFFGIFGQFTWVVRFVQILLYTGTVTTTYQIGKTISRSVKVGLLASLLIAIPSLDLTLYTTISLGGYGEALFLGNLILLTAISLARKISPMPAAKGDETSLQSKGGEKSVGFILRCLSLGFLIGLGLWANGITLVYSVPALVYLWILLIIQKSGRRSRTFITSLAAMVSGFCVGAIPLEIYLVNTGPQQLIHEYLGSAVAVETGAWLTQAASHLVNFLLLGIPVIFSFRPPWGVTWLVLPFIPILSFFWAWVLISIIKEIRHRNDGWLEFLLLFGVMGLVFIGFIVTPYGVDPSGRYFLPLTVPLVIFAAYKIGSTQLLPGLWRRGLLILVVGFNIVGTTQCVLSGPQSFTTQFDSTTVIDHRFDSQLINFLEQNKEFYGYSNYWTAYPIDFLSSEKITLIPSLPYHLDFRYTSRDDRYAPYDAMVAGSQKVAYITTNFEALDQQLRMSFSKNGITWKEVTIGDYQVFYDLSEPLRPDEIILETPTS